MEEVVEAVEQPTDHRSYKDRWRATVFRVICLSLKKRITRYQKSKRAGNLLKISYLEWRLGLNLYKSGKFERALAYLEKVCSGVTLGRANAAEEFLHPDSNVHLAAARCCVGLYKASMSHQYLKRAYVHYQNTVDKMHAFASIVELPGILFEFCWMLEEFGSFQAAADMYSKILSNFQSYRGYFNALYRSAVVGKHIASMSDNPAEQSDILNKATQALLFLLEALPTHINEVRNAVISCFSIH